MQHIKKDKKRNELCNQLVTIRIHCQVSDSNKLWENNYKILAEYITSMKRKRLHLKDLQISDKQIEAYSLLEIENMLIKHKRSLRDIDGMPLPDNTLMRNVGYHLIN